MAVQVRIPTPLRNLTDDQETVTATEIGPNAGIFRTDPIPTVEIPPGVPSPGDGVLQAAGDLVEDRAGQVAGHLLGEPGGDEALRANDPALVGLDLAVDELQQRRLPFTVAAHQPDPLAGVDAQRGLIQQGRAVELQRDVP